MKLKVYLIYYWLAWNLLIILIGIADGSKLPFEWIFAINLRVELLHLLDPSDDQIVMECSDFHLIDESNVNFYSINKI